MRPREPDVDEGGPLFRAWGLADTGDAAARAGWAFGLLLLGIVAAILAWAVRS